MSAPPTERRMNTIGTGDVVGNGSATVAAMYSNTSARASPVSSDPASTTLSAHIPLASHPL
jgi:hypothetical protein